jgi:SMI1 / KNR4 family (SUKH-1)
VKDEAKQEIEMYTKSLPEELRQPPATEHDVKAFEAIYGLIPEDYKWFLLTCGGGIFGSDQFDNIEKLARSHMKFASESALPDGWTMQNVFVIGWDGGGNPFGIERNTGRILVEDHDSGDVLELAQNFELFILERIRT